MSNYIQEAVKLDNKNYTGVVNGIDSKTMRFLHGAIGVSTEAGELLDALKKRLMYGKELDLVNIKEEIGDVLWYCAIMLDEMGVSFEDAMSTNIAKLKLRYPEKFDPNAALNRNLDAERKVLEGNGKQ